MFLATEVPVPTPSALNLIDELKLRRWARLNYVPAVLRSTSWHPAILNEMAMKDAELQETTESDSRSRSIVPVEDFRILRFDSAHPIGKSARVTTPSVRSEFHFS